MIVVSITTVHLTPLFERASKRKTLHPDSHHPVEQKLAVGTASRLGGHGLILVIGLLSRLLSPDCFKYRWRSVNTELYP